MVTIVVELVKIEVSKKIICIINSCFVIIKTILLSQSFMQISPQKFKYIEHNTKEMINNSESFAFTF